MVESNKKFVIFLTLFMLSSLPKFLLLFGVKLHFILFMLLIVFPVLSSKIKLHMSAFLGHLQVIIIFTPLVVPVLFFFSHMSITNLSLGQGFVVFLALAKLKRGIDVMIMSLIIFVSPANLSFVNIAPLSSSLTFIPPYLPPLSWIFFQMRHIFPMDNIMDSLIDFSIQPPDIFDPLPSSPFNEQVEDE